MSRRLVCLLVAILCSPQAAFATLACSRFDSLLRDNAIPFDGVSLGSSFTQGTKPPGLRIDFKPTATEAQRNQANALADSFDWLDKPDPSPSTFVIDCVNDAGIPAAQRQNIAIAGLAFKAGEKALALTIWNLIKAALSSNAAAINAIRTHAANSNITLP